MRMVGIETSFGPSTTEKDLFKYAGLGDLEGVERVLALDKGAVSGRIDVQMYICINVSMHQAGSMGQLHFCLLHKRAMPML